MQQLMPPRLVIYDKFTGTKLEGTRLVALMFVAHLPGDDIGQDPAGPFFRVPLHSVRAAPGVQQQGAAAAAPQSILPALPTAALLTTADKVGLLRGAVVSIYRGRGVIDLCIITDGEVPAGGGGGGGGGGAALARLVAIAEPEKALLLLPEMLAWPASKLDAAGGGWVVMGAAECAARARFGGLGELLQHGPAPFMGLPSSVCGRPRKDGDFMVFACSCRAAAAHRR
ncbi:MAG: hypothetical protein J3K34DRAFT_501170 [Monoraphidium minutum]|nr:MAG: hypothetical protein J3K34DRAFT_501170 [Monoraphidium minutum]